MDFSVSLRLHMARSFVYAVSPLAMEAPLTLSVTSTLKPSGLEVQERKPLLRRLNRALASGQIDPAEIGHTHLAESRGRWG